MKCYLQKRRFETSFHFLGQQGCEQMKHDGRHTVISPINITSYTRIVNIHIASLDCSRRLETNYFHPPHQFNMYLLLDVSCK